MSDIGEHQKSTAAIHADAVARPNFDLRRVFCMDGSAAQNINASFDADIRPNVGEYCMLNLEHSADTERDARSLRQRPDKALLAPYQRIAADKGLPEDMGSAQAALAMLTRGARDPRSADTIGPARLPLATGQNLVLVPGVAWDAGFTSTILATRRGQPQPPATMPRAIQIEEAARCFTNVQQYIQACFEGGVQQARTYLAQPKVAGAVR